MLCQSNTGKVSPVNDRSLAMYIHYPYCLSRCSYCGFATAVDNANQAEQYRDALLKEVELRADQSAWSKKTIHSIYLGGGTPSLMPVDYLSKLFDIIHNRWQIAEDIEITIETNPTDIKQDTLDSFRKIGINRLSIGAQSFDSEELILLGRRHSPEDIVKTVNMAHKVGFTNISLDLLYSVPNQSVNRFRDNVMKALDLRIDHLSTYALSIVKDTPFDRSIANDVMPCPDPDNAAEQYAGLVSIMKNAGFEHYELTNYAKPGYRSRHNCAYWTRQPYLGIGCAAHSFDSINRSWNSSDTLRYIQSLLQGNDPLECCEKLSQSEVFEEDLYLSLRTDIGIPRLLLDKKIDRRTVDELMDNGFLMIQCGKYLIPEDRWLLLDEIILRLLASIEQVQS